MRLNNIIREHPNYRSVQVGRGGKRGKTSGRGGKGQTARAGHKVRPEIRDLIKRLPKLRGRGKNLNTSIQERPAEVSLRALNVAFESGAEVTPAALLAKGLVRASGGKMPQVKVLANGELSKALTLSGLLYSKSAKERVEKAGGKIHDTNLRRSGLVSS